MDFIHFIFSNFFPFFIFVFFADGYSDIEARLVLARKYVEKGSSVTLYCEHNVDPKILYKVSITSFFTIIPDLELHKHIFKSRIHL